MSPTPVVIKLRCTTWGQVSTIYERDLRRNALFLRTPAPLPLGREVRVDVVMPSGTAIALEGRVAHHVSGDRGSGVELVLTQVPPSALWLIESALARATPEPTPPLAVAEDHEASAAEQGLAAALEAELRSYRVMDAHQVLGIGRDGDEAAARTAFGELAKRYHPDRFARYESERLRSLAAEIFVLMRDAYRQIARGTPARGAGTPASGLAIAPTELAARPRARPTRPPEAQAAVVTFTRTEPPRPTPGLTADELFGDLEHQETPPTPPAVSLDNPGVAAADGLLAGGRLDEAIAGYEAVLRAHPIDRAARSGRELALGLKLAAAGDRAGAAERFETALEIEPWNERAARELTAVRRTSTERGKSLLARLLGKGAGT